MKKIITLMFAFFPFCWMEAVDSNDTISNELIMVNDLIEATRQNLAQQIKLRDLIQNYQDLQKRYLQSADDSDLLFNMVKTAHLILEIIKENHLIQAFDPAFLSELTLMSKPAAKMGIPKPS